MTLGYIAAFSETLALSVIVAKGVSPLALALVTEGEEHIKSACAWSLGQIGRHSPDHAKTLADNAVLPKLLKVLTTTTTPPTTHHPSPTTHHPHHHPTGGVLQGPHPSPPQPQDDTVGSDLKTKTQRALKCILEKTLHLDALEPLLHPTTPSNILKYVVGQFAKILPHDGAARREFVTCGALQRVQEIAASFGSAGGVGGEGGAGKGGVGVPVGLVGTKLGEYIRTINECYPEEIVRYYSPGYSTTLLEKIDEYSRSHDAGNPAMAGIPGAGGGGGASSQQQQQQQQQHAKNLMQSDFAPQPMQV
ncbi:Sperm-associated antigen 6 [Dinochytrium kinnereticum]|nr:Sperm-associated antigen 6 [Dinochytrium kinnereticum]